MANADARPLSVVIADEIEKLQGTWRQIAYQRDGNENPDDETGWEPRTTYTGNTFVVMLADGSIPIKGICKLDPTQDPKALDLTDTFGADAGKTFPAIYCLAGDLMAFCAADEGQDRPTEFRTRRGRVLRVFLRETP